MRLTPLIALVLLACSATPPDDSKRWVRVARDANYTIYIDTGRYGGIRGPGYTAFDVWYRTDHALPRMHEKGKDKVQFNREVVHSIIQCDKMLFRVASVDMSMGSGRPLVQQRLTPSEVQNQKWRSVEMGTAEEIAARAACHFAHPDGAAIDWSNERPRPERGR
jgi:hypothetical protein